MELTIEKALQQGVVAHKEGNLQIAEQLYHAILQVQPSHPDANHNLGVIAVSVSNTELALPLFKTALESNPKIEQFWLSYIGALIKENQLEEAGSVLEKGKKMGLAGKKVDVLRVQLKQMLQEASSKLFQRNKTLTLKEKREKIAESKQQKKQVKSKRAIKVSPSQQKISRLLEHYQNGNYDEAEKLAESISKKFPTHQLSWQVLGAVYRATGRKSEAVTVNQRAVQVAPQDVAGHYNLGIALQDLGRLEEAEESFRQAIMLKPDDAEAHYNVGNTLKIMGRLEEAQASYKQAIVFGPDFAKAHNNLGNTLQELGRLEEAVASYGQAILLNSDYFEAHYNLGNTLQELVRLEEAVACYRQAILLNPDFAKAHSNLGIVLYGIGDKDSALSSITRANLIDPKSKDCSMLLSVLQARNERESAEAIVANIINSDCNIEGPSKIIILNRLVEQELIAYLYKLKSRNLDKDERDPSFGNTRGSRNSLFQDDHSTIKNLVVDLKSMLMKYFNSDVFVYDSFFTIFGAGGGTVPHNHLNSRDRDSILSLAKQKYSLVYYLSVGDQECSEPGILKFYEPSEEVLPSEGLITIFPAGRYHNAVYGGNTDRVIIGVNFYSL